MPFAASPCHPHQHHQVPSFPELRQAGITVFERGWLSSNNILIQGEGPSALVDSGYASHADQTLALIQAALNGGKLDLLLNTHLHSDHCGGNALLQSTFAELQTWIPPGLASAVAEWDPVALTFEPTGQTCARFGFQQLLAPGTTIRLGSLDWQVHAAKGHDPHSIVLHQPDFRILISADALWKNGFGVVFPELEGLDAFDDVAQTLDLIEQLDPATVIPGHGPVFQDVAAAIEGARSRLASFVGDPGKHKRHALKVLLKFKLLEWQRVQRAEMDQWSQRTPYIRLLATEGSSTPFTLEAAAAFLDPFLAELERSRALRIEGDWVINC